MANGVQSSIQVGDRCFRPTDGRGYGYWTSCDQVYTFVLSKGLKARDSEVQSQMDRGSDGGGGDGGSSKGPLELAERGFIEVDVGGDLLTVAQ
jgi:hypothetical protein